MNEISETPFHDIESALEYINLLLDAAQEAKEQVGADLLRALEPKLERRRQGLQLVIHKLTQLTSHLSASRRILGDLRMLRRVLASEARALQPSHGVGERGLGSH
jgi:hypothetical protein